MSEQTDSQHRELAAAFGRDLDPLAEFEVGFEKSDADPFDLFLEDVIDSRDLVPATREHYNRTFRQWRKFMAERERHPACPSTSHVKAFIRHQRDVKGNHPGTIKDKLQRLNSAYEWWQDEPALPHPRDFNPIASAQNKVNLDNPEIKEPPRIPVETLRDVLTDVPHVRDRAIITAQLKLGLRVSELCNIQLSEVDIQNTELREHYPNLGTHRMLEDRPNAVYIPHDRAENKSKRPRVLPLDNELKRVLLRYLLIRPDTDQPWLFLADATHDRLLQAGVMDAWKNAFRPEYDETEHHRAVTSHFGRHRFTTYWRVERDVNYELIQYMRGDKTGRAPGEGRGAIDRYIHTYYEDIEPIYRKQIYTLGV